MLLPFPRQRHLTRSGLGYVALVMLQMLCGVEAGFLQRSYVLANVSALDLNLGLWSLPSLIWEEKFRFLLSVRLKWCFF